jgi:hypothetical protein
MNKYYTFPNSNFASDKILEHFKFLEDEYHYKIISNIIEKYYVKIIYENIEKIIEISNETNYSDYGFSIFIKDIQTSENKMVINIPYEKEDKECNFIKTSSEYLKSNYNFISKFLLKDILNRIKKDYKRKSENNYVKNKLLTLYTKNINIGIEQLMRCILVIANGEKCIIDKIFKENFYNDPRDVAMEAMAIDNSINYGINRFED